MDRPRQKWRGFFVSCMMVATPDIALFTHVDIGIPELELFSMLHEQLAWRDEPITMFGKTFLQPRRIAWYGDEHAVYTYSGKMHSPLPWVAPLRAIMRVAEDLAATSFNSVLCNLYRNGNDSMGYHSDDEPELGRNPVIASFSIGAERVLHFRHKHDKTVATVKVPMPSMSMLVMRGDTQHAWKHALPKTSRCDQARINLTFRRIL